MLRLPLLVAALLGRARADDWVKHTVYRTTPINYTGLTNMDSGDAHGDVYFGLAQLVLPPLCKIDPGFLWCQNRKFLSDGAAHMVYTEFVIEARPAYGDYQPCNPDQKTGIFACDMGGGSSSPAPPPQCNANGNMAYMEDGLNGTIYRTLQAAEGECCTACSNERGKCHGWSMPMPGSSICHLLQEPLVQWDDALKNHGVRSGEHVQGGGSGWSHPCWYADPEYNTTAAFVAACDRAKCSCDAIERLSLGREQSAMCWHHGPPPPPATITGRSVVPLHNKALAYSDSPEAEAGAPQWWTCSGAVYDACYDALKAGSASTCEACVAKQLGSVAKAGCTDPKAAAAICRANNVTCSAALASACPSLLHSGGKNTFACQTCARGSAAVAAAGCSSELVNNACYSGDDDNEWEDYIQQLACLMNGTWYSTQAAGECGPEGKGPNCWWRIAETKRTVNQSCVDGRVVDAVKKARGNACWENCGPHATNSTSSCWIRCFYDTILKGGNGEPMTAAEIAGPFVAAFEPVSQGGCASVAQSDGSLINPR